MSTKKTDNLQEKEIRGTASKLKWSRTTSLSTVATRQLAEQSNYEQNTSDASVFVKKNSDIMEKRTLFPEARAIHDFLEVYITTGVIEKSLEELTKKAGDKEKDDLDVEGHLFDLKSLLADINEKYKIAKEGKEVISDDLKGTDRKIAEVNEEKKNLLSTTEVSKDTRILYDKLIRKYKEIIEQLKDFERSDLNTDDYERQLLTRLQFIQGFSDRVEAATVKHVIVEITRDESLRKMEDQVGSSIGLAEELERNETYKQIIAYLEKETDKQCIISNQIDLLWGRIVYECELTGHNLEQVACCANSSDARAEEKFKCMIKLVQECVAAHMVNEYLLNPQTTRIAQAAMINDAVGSRIESQPDLDLSSKDAQCISKMYTNDLNMPGIADWFARPNLRDEQRKSAEQVLLEDGFGKVYTKRIARK